MFLVFFLLLFTQDPRASGCEDPIEFTFTPTRLVVKYEDPTSAICSYHLCQQANSTGFFDLERSVGEVIMKEPTKLEWRVEHMTVWDTVPICYYSFDSGEQRQKGLSVTVYQPPKRVQISFSNHSGPMVAGQSYALGCTVQEVAPVGDLTVTFYSGETELGQRKANGNQAKTPVNETFTLNISPSEADDGGQYWCEAKLELGAEGPQLPPVVKSEKVTAIVYYLNDLPKPDQITVTAGNPLQLNCSAVGNPSPSYTWMLPSGLQSHDSTLHIESVTLEHKGKYSCHVENNVRNILVMFDVDVKENPIFIILGVIAAIILLLVLTFMYLYYYYKKNRKGQYKLKDVFRRRSTHIPVPHEV